MQCVVLLQSYPSISTTSLIIFYNDKSTTEIYTLSLHDALPIFSFAVTIAPLPAPVQARLVQRAGRGIKGERSEEHTSELQSLRHLVCRLLLEKKNARRP